MKTINFLTTHFIPENTACTNRVLSFVRELEKTYKVNVICLTEKGEKQQSTIISYTDQIDIHYVNQKKFDGKNFFKRALYEIFYISQLVQLSKKTDCDMVIATSPYMFMIPLIGYGLNGPKILDIRDLVWEYLDDKNLVQRGVKRVLKVIMKQGIRHFDHVVVTNEYESELLKDHYGVNNIDILFNGIEKRRYDKLIDIQLAKETPFTVTYVGNIGLAQNIRTIIDTAKQLPEIKFIIIGTGIELQDIKEHVDKKQIKNVLFTGKIPWYKLHEYYEKTSVLYAQLDEKFISAVPSKLYEYASVGVPIIYGGVGQAAKFVENLENSKVVTPNNVDELVDAITQMEQKDTTISKKNRLLIHERFLREEAAQKIVKIVNETIR